MSDNTTPSLEDIAQNLSELLTNSVNIVDQYYNMFFNETPMYVELQQYNSQGQLITHQVPNRAMNQTVALSGVTDPEGLVEANLGQLYVNTVTRNAFLKGTPSGSSGWINITPDRTYIMRETFSVTTSTSYVTLTHSVESKDNTIVFVDGNYLEVSKYSLTNNNTITFLEAFTASGTVEVRYFINLVVADSSVLTQAQAYANEAKQYRDETIAQQISSITVGTVTTGAAGSQASVTNVGTQSNQVWDMSIPQGAKGDTGAKGDKGETVVTASVGTTTTLASGTPATVTNSGTDTELILDFGIPQGVKGDSGVFVGSSTPSNDYDVWVDPTGNGNNIVVSDFANGVVVSSFNNPTTNQSIPTEKLVKDNLDLKVNNTDYATTSSKGIVQIKSGVSEPLQITDGVLSANKATGSYSVTISGNGTSTNSSTNIGVNSTAHGWYSTALGCDAVVGDNTNDVRVPGAVQIGRGSNQEAGSLKVGLSSNGTTWNNYKLMNSDGGIPADRLTRELTNCILEDPQNIKLELNNGTLTLKAGSVVCVPNGFESDGVTPKFDEVAIQNDINYASDFGYQNLHVCCINPTTQSFYGPEDIIIFSGATAPTVLYTYALWYDTSANKIKWTTNSGSTWIETGVSLPICTIRLSASTTVTSIEQTFQSIGYIGSTVFVRKGLKVLIPNGRNADGSLKNIEVTINRVTTRTLLSSDNANYFGIDTNGNVYYADSSYYYNNELNRNIAWNNEWRTCVVVSLNSASGVISNFQPYTATNILKYGDAYTKSEVYTKSEADSNYVNVTGDTMSGALTVNNNIQANTFISNGGQGKFGSVELGNGGTSAWTHGGFVDFHYNGSTADYTSRIIENGSGYLTIEASNGIGLPQSYCIDGQWVRSQGDLITAWTTINPASALSYSLSSYLPNDGKTYELLVTLSGSTGSTSGNTAQMSISTDLVGSIYRIASATTTANSSVQWAGATIAPVGTGRWIAIHQLHDSHSCQCRFFRCLAYRRVGTNW